MARNHNPPPPGQAKKAVRLKRPPAQSQAEMDSVQNVQLYMMHISKLMRDLSRNIALFNSVAASLQQRIEVIEKTLSAKN